MDTRLLQRAFSRFHLAVYLNSGGQFGHGLSGTSSLVLTTTGRRTGRPRRTVLVYARQGDDMVVVASNYGGDRPPAWLLNIRTQARVEVLVARRRTTAAAREVTADDPRYPALWALVNAHNHDRYTEHQRSTARSISLVVITPDAASVV